MRENMVYNPRVYQLREFQLRRMLAIIEQQRFPRPGGVVFYGDSLTEFYPIERCFGELAAAHDVALYNCGIGGATTEELMWIVDEAVIKYQPRAVVLMAGTNDLGRTRQAAPLEIALGLRALVDVILGNLPDARILLWSPLPCREEIDGAGAKPGVLRANALLRQIPREYAALPHEGRVELVDTYPALTDAAGAPRAELYRPGDGLHINDAGYDCVTAVLAPELERLLGC